MNKIIWTPKEIKRLRELARVTCLDDLVRLLKKPRNSVIWKIRQQGLKAKHPNSLTYPEMKRIFNFSTEFGIKEAMVKFNLTVDQVKGLRIRYRKINKKNIENIDPENLVDLRKKCLSFGSRKGLSREKAEDFASHSIIKKIELGHVRISLENLYRNWYYLKDVTKDRLTKEFDETYLKHNSEGIDDLGLDFKNLIEHLEPQGRTILFLSLVHNIAFEDIGFCLDISPYMVGYYYNKNLKTLKKNKNIKNFR